MRTLEKEQNVTYANTFDSHSVPIKAIPRSTIKVKQLIIRISLVFSPTIETACDLKNQIKHFI